MGGRRSRQEDHYIAAGEFDIRENPFKRWYISSIQYFHILRFMHLFYAPLFRNIMQDCECHHAP